MTSTMIPTHTEWHDYRDALNPWTSRIHLNHIFRQTASDLVRAAVTVNPGADPEMVTGSIKMGEAPVDAMQNPALQDSHLEDLLNHVPWTEQNLRALANNPNAGETTMEAIYQSNPDSPFLIAAALYNQNTPKTILADILDADETEPTNPAAILHYPAASHVVNRDALDLYVDYVLVHRNNVNHLDRLIANQNLNRHQVTRVWDAFRALGTDPNDIHYQFASHPASSDDILWELFNHATQWGPEGAVGMVSHCHGTDGFLLGVMEGGRHFQEAAARNPNIGPMVYAALVHDYAPSHPLLLGLLLTNRKYQVRKDAWNQDEIHGATVLLDKLGAQDRVPTDQRDLLMNTGVDIGIARRILKENPNPHNPMFYQAFTAQHYCLTYPLWVEFHQHQVAGGMVDYDFYNADPEKILRYDPLLLASR